ncbi:Hypothetical protein FKW44_007091, partial [Caligus rogercresseyi]
EEEETPYHLIFDCPSTRQKIISLEGDIGERRLAFEDFIFKAFKFLNIDKLICNNTESAKIGSLPADTGLSSGEVGPI